MSATPAPGTPAAGERWSGLLDVLPGEAPPLPCVVVQGDAPGPRLVVTAGVHGAEYASIVAAQRIARLPAAGLRGTLVVAPILNTAAYFARSIYVNPLDGKNLNRVFPGAANGSASERLAHWTVTTLLAGADATVDLHGGDLVEALTPFVLHHADDAEGRALADAFGLGYRVAQSGGGMTVAAAHAIGVPAVLAEAGGQGLWPEEAVATLEHGVLRVMRALGMRAEAPDTGVVPQAVSTFAWSRSEATGCWVPAVGVGQTVRPGDPLGVVTDLLGTTVQEPRSEVAGTVLFAVSSLAINAGDPLVGVGATG